MDKLAQDEVVHRVKRFKHQSYAESLKDVHLPSALELTEFDRVIADNESHFYVSLQQWRQLNLSPSFVQFAKKADPLSLSMPFLLHNWKDIVELWMAALDTADDEGLRALLDLLQKLAHDLRTTLSPVYADLLAKLLVFLPRPIATPALTSLLATLSALFRYLLVPSIHLDLLQQTWTSFHAVLPSCNPEVQRAAAEVWASVLRRLKTSAREKAVLLMANNLDGVESASAWMLVFACKSVSSTLHTTSPAMLGPVIDCYLTCKDPDSLYTLLRRTLTCIIHHCKGPEQFSSIAEILVARFSAAASSLPADDAETERLRRTLQLTSVVCSARQGSRLSPSQLSQLASVLPNISITPPIETALLHFSVALLTAGNASMATTGRRQFITEALQAPTFGASFLGALAQLSCGGWKMDVLPALFRSTSHLLAAQPKQTLRLFAHLRHADKLGEVDLVWKHTMDVWLCERLSRWELDPDGVVELRNMVSLSAYVDRMPTLLAGIVQRMLDAPDPEQSWHASHANSAWVLWTCMRSLAESMNASWRQQVDLIGWTRMVVQRWSWSQCALDGLAGLVQSSPSTGDAISFTELYLHLRPCIISHSRSLRLSALKILSSKLVKSSPGELDVLKRCLQGEEVSLDAQGVRERVLRMGRIGQVIKDDEPLAADLCIRWLISQFKVNLRPLWSPAAEALSSLTRQFGDAVWACLFDELQVVTKPNETGGLAPWLNENVEQDVNNDTWEEERTWKDGAAHRMRTVISSWLDEEHDRKAIILDQKPTDRFDPASYESQLLSTLGQCASLAERHNRDLVSFFLSLTVNDDTFSTLPRNKLHAWLTLFSKFTNPKALYATDTLFSLYRTFLSHSDRALQTVALGCVLTYKQPSLVRHEETLRYFLDDTLWRDELAHLDLSSLDATDRPIFVDTLIRLLFGMMLEKKGCAKGGDKRAAVLGALAVCTEDELGLLIDLMLTPMGLSSRGWQEGGFVLTDVPSNVSPKQQVGFLNLLGQVLRHLGPRVVPHWPALFGTVLNLTTAAQSRLGGSKPSNVPVLAEAQGEEADVDADADVDDNVDEVSTTKSSRTIRQLGLRRLANFFHHSVSFDYAPYLRASFDAIISPRLALLDQENTQAPSALLDVFYLWASRPEHVRFLVDYDCRVLPKVLDCLVATNVKPAVLTHIFDMVDRLLAFSSEDTAIADDVVKPHLSLLLTNLMTLVERTKGDQQVSSPLAQRQISILSQVVHHVADPAQASALVTLFSPLLRKSSKIVPEKTKINLLTNLDSLFPLAPDLSDPASPTFSRVYELLSRLFFALHSGGARLALTATLNRLAVIHSPLGDLASTLESLNAYSTKRVNEPDFDRRLTGWTTLNEDQYAMLTAHEWLPVLYNALHFIQDPDELAIRSSAALTLRRFVGVVASHDNEPSYEQLLVRTILPTLKNVLRSKTELVRAEALGVIAHAVLHCDRVASLQEMRPLLAGGDDEASFFSNIHHVQIHRRTRALRRLTERCEQGHLKSKTLVEIFVPLVEHYVVPTSSLDHLLVAEAIKTLGWIAGQLHWSAYYALVKKYLGRVKDEDKDKEDVVRVHARALVALLEHFHFSMEEPVVDDAAVVGDDGNDDDGDGERPRETTTSDVQKISDTVNQRLLPSLLAHLDARDDAHTAVYIPLAVGIAHITLHLPMPARHTHASKLLTVLSQALRSRSQDIRDSVRETLCRVVGVLGVKYVAVALGELRGALQRGTQVHVLACVVHALLTSVTSKSNTNVDADPIVDLDDCIADIAHVASEVIFGEPAQDAQNAEFKAKTRMREVKGSLSRGLDCFAILARYTSPSHIRTVLVPLRSVMTVTNSARIMQQVDEVLRRIASGLNANPRVGPAELLVLCHTLVSQNAQFLREKEKTSKAKDSDHVVQTKRKIAYDSDCYVHNAYRFVVLGLDIFTTAYRRSRFDLHDAQLLARLEPFVNLIGNTLYAESDAVLVTALKAAPCILQCPLNAVPSSAPLMARQILSIIRSVGTTESEIAQTALKSLATILRECPTANMKEDDLLFLLELVAPDLEEPSRQTSVFVLLRAIVARKLVVPELYDLMTTISTILVTSQSAHTRESARSLLLQFLLDYPQGAGKLQTILAFLARNVSYEHPSGRASVLELLHALVTKFDVGLMSKYAEMLFVALVLCVANDGDKGCRVAAAGVIEMLVRRFGEKREVLERTVMGHVHAWTAQTAQTALRSVGVQVYGMVVEALQQGALPYLDTILDDLGVVGEASCARLSAHEGEGEMEEEEEEEDEGAWHATYQMLQVLVKVLGVFPEATTAGKVRWTSVIELLGYPHAWVRSAACRLVGVLFAASSTSSSVSETEVWTDAVMRRVADKLCGVLKSPNVEASVALQAVKNLFFVGKWFVVRASGEVDEKDSEEDALPWLFSKLSFQARSAQIARRNRSVAPSNWALSPLSVLRFFAAMTSYMEGSQVERFLPHMLTPVYRITEEDTIRDAGMEELKTTAIELQDLVQAKVGTSVFAGAYRRIREGVVNVQRARRVARATKATTNPEGAARRKMARNAMKKESRKRKQRTFAESRGRVKRQREE